MSDFDTEFEKFMQDAIDKIESDGIQMGDMTVKLISVAVDMMYLLVGGDLEMMNTMITGAEGFMQKRAEFLNEGNYLEPTN